MSFVFCEVKLAERQNILEFPSDPDKWSWKWLQSSLLTFENRNLRSYHHMCTFLCTVVEYFITESEFRALCSLYPSVSGSTTMNEKEWHSRIAFNHFILLILAWNEYSSLTAIQYKLPGLFSMFACNIPALSFKPGLQHHQPVGYCFRGCLDCNRTLCVCWPGLIFPQQRLCAEMQQRKKTNRVEETPGSTDPGFSFAAEHWVRAPLWTEKETHSLEMSFFGMKAFVRAP